MSKRAAAYKAVTTAANAVADGKKGARQKLMKAVKRYANASCALRVTKNTKGKQVTAKVSGKRKKKAATKRRK